jgi:hypothetical protein
MPRKNRNHGLTEEQLAVLRSSPNLKPCRKFRKDHLRRSKNPNSVMRADKFADYYRRNQPKLFGKPFASFLQEHVFAKFDFNNGASPSSINRHAILHGDIRLRDGGEFVEGVLIARHDLAICSDS